MLEQVGGVDKKRVRERLGGGKPFFAYFLLRMNKK